MHGRLWLPSPGCTYEPAVPVRTRRTVTWNHKLGRHQESMCMTLISPPLTHSSTPTATSGCFINENNDFICDPYAPPDCKNNRLDFHTNPVIPFGFYSRNQRARMMEVAPFYLKCPSCRQPSGPLRQNVKAFIATENFLKLARELWNVNSDESRLS